MGNNLIFIFHVVPVLHDLSKQTEKSHVSLPLYHMPCPLDQIVDDIMAQKAKAKSKKTFNLFWSLPIMRVPQKGVVVKGKA